MNKRQAVAVVVGLVVFGWLVWPDLSPYVMQWLGPRGSHLTVTYYGFPTGRIVAAMAVLFFTAMNVYNLRSRMPPYGEIKASDDTQDGVWPPAPKLPQ